MIFPIKNKYVIHANTIEVRTPTDGLTFPVFTTSRSNDINREGWVLGGENKTGLREAKMENKEKEREEGLEAENF